MVKEQGEAGYAGVLSLDERLELGRDECEFWQAEVFRAVGAGRIARRDNDHKSGRRAHGMHRMAYKRFVGERAKLTYLAGGGA